MAEPQEIPQLVRELADLSKRYLEQETLDPLRRLGKYSGMGIGAGALWMFTALFVGLGVYVGMQQVLPEGEWWTVLARFTTVVVTAAGAGLIGWRISKAIEAPRATPSGPGPEAVTPAQPSTGAATAPAAPAPAAASPQSTPSQDLEEGA